MVQFDSVDPAALVVAIIAIIVSFEQLARAAFDSQTRRMRRIVMHILCSSDLNTEKIKALDDNDFLLLVEVGLRATTFLRNGKHPAIYSVFRIWPSSLFMGPQAWCIRRNFGIGAVAITIWSYFVYLLPWVWNFYRVNGGPKAWATQGMDWKYENHNAGYSGKQFDMCIEHLFYKLDGMTDESIKRLLLVIAYVASNAESKYIGPCVTTQVACGQEVTFGALLCDIKLRNPKGHLGVGIHFDSVWNTVCVMSLHYQSYTGTRPVFDDLPGIANIVRYYRDASAAAAEDKAFYDIHVTKMFPAFRPDDDDAQSMETYPFWCLLQCENFSQKKCVWRGRPILVMTESEMISTALSGRLNRLKCLVFDLTREKYEIERLIKDNHCDIDTVFEQCVDIDRAVSRLRDCSYIILARPPPAQTQQQAQAASYYVQDRSLSPRITC